MLIFVIYNSNPCRFGLGKHKNALFPDKMRTYNGQRGCDNREPANSKKKNPHSSIIIQ
jgi:hypothetical protein